MLNFNPVLNALVGTKVEAGYFFPSLLHVPGVKFLSYDCGKEERRIQKKDSKVMKKQAKNTAKEAKGNNRSEERLNKTVTKKWNF